ncbi:MAG: hypothetical protein RI907_939 [Pseudomonadota bacterium]|jgi:hypothetical protein
MSTPSADTLPGVDFDLAVLGRGLPAEVEAWLRQAGQLGPHAPQALELLLQARAAAPEHPATLIALYRYHFYGHRLSQALEVAEETLAHARAALMPPVAEDPGALPHITDEQARFDAAARFYLFTLKGYAYLSLRLGRLDSGRLALSTLRLLDPQDRLGGAVLQAVLARAERAARGEDEVDFDEQARLEGRKPHRGWGVAS